MPALREQTALITGGASGIGNAIATALASEGVRVTIADLSPEVERAARETAERSGGTVRGLQVNVADAAQVEAMVDNVVRDSGALHILGNIAGIYRRHTALEMTPEQWDQTLNANLRSAYLCTHFALPHMVRQGYGRIISMASGIAVAGAPRSSAYAASKAGLIAFTKSVGPEVYEHGITINCIAPGITDTPMSRGAATPEEIERAVARAGRPLGKAEDVTGLFLFLVSDAASMITGVTLQMRNP